MRYFSKSRRSYGLILPVIASVLLWAVIVFALLALAGGCAPYDPSLYPSYDVLNPGEEVRRNPLAFTDDGNLIVTPSFIAWVDELKQEVIKLRKQLQ